MKASLKFGALVAWALFGGGLASCGRASGNGTDDEPRGDGTCATEADCGVTQHCLRALQLCVSCRDDDDCVESDTCVDWECQAATGGAGPDDGSAGAGNAPEPVDGGAGGEGPGTGPCDPGSRVCDGPNVKLCSANGSQWTIDDTCSLTQACVSGACRDIECVPNRELCRDQQIWACGEDGTTADLVKQCGADQYCIEEDGDASCSDTVCVPTAALCKGQVATSCKPDGSGPAAGGQNCAETAEICYDGECRDRACTLGEKLCQHGDVYLCAEGGSDVALFRDCAENESCDAVLGSCAPTVCDPGEKTCDGTRAYTCNGLGTGWLTNVDCASTGAACVDGACQPKICLPGFRKCEGNDAYACNALGVAYELERQCDAGYYCAVYGNYATCEIDYCVPGETLCTQNELHVCNEDGNINGTLATPCGSGEVCAADGKSCTAQVCKPNSSFCRGKTVVHCHRDGLTTQDGYDCPSTAYCRDDPAGYAACEPYDCLPNERACLANQVGTCQADGLALANVSLDCAQRGQVCDGTLTCAANAVDQLGAAEELESNASLIAVGDAIDVLSTRKLTELEARLVTTVQLDVHWLVYEHVADFVYTKKLEKVVSRPGGVGYVSSGPIAMTLEAGKRYLLAVMVAGGSMVAYFDEEPLGFQPSFGRFVGSIRDGGAAASIYAYPNAARSYELRVTTTAP